jgi:magnesium transporter
MEEHPVSVRVDEDQEEVARKISRYDVLALPVVDDGEPHRRHRHPRRRDGRAAGRGHRGLPQGRHGRRPGQSVRDASIGLLYRKRIGWLVLLVFGNLLSGAGIALLRGHHRRRWWRWCSSCRC